MKILFAVFDGPDDFLDRLSLGAEAPVGRVRVRTKARYVRDEPVILEIGFPGLPNRILVRAKFGCDRGEGEAEFMLIDGEGEKRDFLVAVASGRAVASWKRRHRRFPLRIQARVVVDEGNDEPVVDAGDGGDATTEELGSGGLSLTIGESLADGAKVTVSLDPADGGGTIEFRGTVVWTREGGSEAGDGSGVGIQFDSLAGEGMKRLRHLIRDVKARGETAE